MAIFLTGRSGFVSKRFIAETLKLGHFIYAIKIIYLTINQFGKLSKFYELHQL